MSQIVTIGNATLYHGEAEEILPHLPAVPLIVTDPPYRLTAGGKDTGIIYGALDGYDNSGQIVPCDIGWDQIMQLAFDGLQEQGRAYVMADDRNIWDAYPAAMAAGFRFHRLLVWKKPQGTPSRWWMKNAELALFLYRGKAITINDPGSQCVQEFPPGRETKHPTEKPVRLMHKMITNSSQPGELVIDPFMGSGTTGVAALQAGRRFIGIEKDARFFDMACKRLQSFATGAEITGQTNLFSYGG